MFLQSERAGECARVTRYTFRLTSLPVPSHVQRRCRLVKEAAGLFLLSLTSGRAFRFVVYSQLASEHLSFDQRERLLLYLRCARDSAEQSSQTSFGCG